VTSSSPTRTSIARTTANGIGDAGPARIPAAVAAVLVAHWPRILVMLGENDVPACCRMRRPGAIRIGFFLPFVVLTSSWLAWCRNDRAFGAPLIGTPS